MTKNEPLITVIVPVYNTARYLPRCIKSIINQTYHNLEIICINDGSTDQSIDILNDYAKNDSRIKIITQKNTGLSGARNAGLKKATGDYITFVDSDDEIKLNMIKNLLVAVTETSSDIAACSFTETFPNGKTKVFNKNFPKKTYDTKNALKAMLKEDGFNLTATMKLFAKSTLRNIKFPIGKLHEDVGTTYKAILQSKKFVFIPKNDYIYHHHHNSIISEFSNQKFDLISLTDQMCDDIDQRFPDLKNITKERRIRSRFSILRQIPLNNPGKKELINYLKEHRDFITKNPEANQNDRLALKLALVSPKLFQLAYKLFK